MAGVTPPGSTGTGHGWGRWRIPGTLPCQLLGTCGIRVPCPCAGSDPQTGPMGHPAHTPCLGPSQNNPLGPCLRSGEALVAAPTGRLGLGEGPAPCAGLCKGRTWGMLGWGGAPGGATYPPLASHRDIQSLGADSQQQPRMLAPGLRGLRLHQSPLHRHLKRDEMSLAHTLPPQWDEGMKTSAALGDMLQGKSRTLLEHHGAPTSPTSPRPCSSTLCSPGCTRPRRSETKRRAAPWGQTWQEQFIGNPRTKSLGMCEQGSSNANPAWPGSAAALPACQGPTSSAGTPHSTAGPGCHVW